MADASDRTTATMQSAVRPFRCTDLRAAFGAELVPARGQRQPVADVVAVVLAEADERHRRYDGDGSQREKGLVQRGNGSGDVRMVGMAEKPCGDERAESHAEAQGQLLRRGRDAARLAGFGVV